VKCDRNDGKGGGEKLQEACCKSSLYCEKKENCTSGEKMPRVRWAPGVIYAGGREGLRFVDKLVGETPPVDRGVGRGPFFQEVESFS